MYSEWVWVVGGVVVVWLSLLTYYLWQERGLLKRFFPGKGVGSRRVLEDLLKELGNLEGFNRKSLGYFQKMALKRYNPYQDAGGNLSFSVALLDGKGDGVVVTSLHSRSGTRVFAKPVLEGKEEGFEFSEEEKQVVRTALKNSSYEFNKFI